MKVDVQIISGSIMYTPPLCDDPKWITERKGVPGKLEFQCLWDASMKIEEGNIVRLIVDGSTVFSGFLFKYSKSKDDQVQMTAYDQIRYLKAKDTYKFEKKKASQIIKTIASDFGLKIGSIADTKYKIASRVEENKTLIDMMQTALDITTTNTGKIYNLYDDAGKLTVRDINSMAVAIVIDENTAEDYQYESSIDGETYNRVKLEYLDDSGNKKKTYIAEDKKTQKKWGTLQYYEKLSEDENGQVKANYLLKLHNQKEKHLSISGAFGDIRVRAGCLLVVKMDIMRDSLQNFMVVDKCTHIFANNEHRMDLTLIGGEFVGD